VKQYLLLLFFRPVNSEDRVLNQQVVLPVLATQEGFSGETVQVEVG
jgi:hypothetical protein